MDLDGILHICDLLGLGYSSPRDGTEDRGPQVSVSCPLAGKVIDGIRFHQDIYDSNHSCSVKIVADGPSLVRCFSGYCGFQGTWLRLLQRSLEQDERPEVKTLLEEISKTETLTLDAKVIRNRKIIEKTINDQLELDFDKDVLPETYWDNFRNKVPKYALSRGITIETCKKWDLGFDKLGSRLVFPVRRRDGKLVGMQGRDITGKAERKHHNYEGFKKEKYLLGAHLLEEGKPIIVVEGAVGAVKVYQAVYPEACVVAPLGEGFSKWHADTIADANPPYICIFTDGDAAGRAIASKIEYQLHGRFPIKLMECPTDIDENGKKIWDPGNMPDSQILELFHNARPIVGRIKWTFPLATIKVVEPVPSEGDSYPLFIGP